MSKTDRTNRREEGLIEGYIVGRGSLCPNQDCQSNQLDTGFPVFGKGYITMPMSCQVCESEWTEVYTLSGITNLSIKE